MEALGLLKKGVDLQLDGAVNVPKAAEERMMSAQNSTRKKDRPSKNSNKRSVYRF
jgi:hypothetical protein